MTDWSDGIKNAITVIIIVVIVGIIFGFVYMAMQANQDGQDKLSAQISSLDEKSFAEFNGTTVSGQKVISAVQQYQGAETGIAITTLKDTSGTNYCAELASLPSWSTIDESSGGYIVADGLTGETSDGKMSMITDKTEDTYIRPNAKFSAHLIRDTNELVVGVAFEQLEN